jgi:hypothetical protein
MSVVAVYVCSRTHRPGNRTQTSKYLKLRERSTRPNWYLIRDEPNVLTSKRCNDVLVAEVPVSKPADFINHFVERRDIPPRHGVQYVICATTFSLHQSGERGYLTPREKIERVNIHIRPIVNGCLEE